MNNENELSDTQTAEQDEIVSQMFDRFYNGFDEHLEQLKFKEQDDIKWKSFWDTWLVRS